MMSNKNYKKISTKGFVWNYDKNWWASKDFKYKITMRSDVGWGYCNDAGRVVKVEWTTTGYDW